MICWFQAFAFKCDLHRYNEGKTLETKWDTAAAEMDRPEELLAVVGVQVESDLTHASLEMKAPVSDLAPEM